MGSASEWDGEEDRERGPGSGGSPGGASMAGGNQGRTWRMWCPEARREVSEIETEGLS